MTTRLQLRTVIRSRLGAANALWIDTELNDYIATSVKGLYPAFYQRKTAQAIAGAGPVQVLPVGARNLFFVGQQRIGSTRVRKIRGWSEGQAQVIINKTGIAGDTLVFAWTEGFTPVTDDVTAMTIPAEAEEVVVLLVHIAALERLLSDRVSSEKYFSLNIREGITEDDIEHTLEALHGSLDQRLQRVIPLPEVQA